MHPEAQEQNQIIKENNSTTYNLLSEKGKNIFFPKKGILSQVAEAKGKKYNATAGIAVNDDGSPFRLKAIEKGVNLSPDQVFPYVTSYGNLELRQKWKELLKKKNYSLKSDFSLPVVTQALTQGLSMVGYLFVDPGDKIILTDKFWGNYRLIFENGYNAVLDGFNTFDRSKFDLDSFRKKLNEKTKNNEDINNIENKKTTEIENKKIILLNFPNNPTGYTLTDEEVEEITKIIKESAEQGKEILVILDDAYFGLVYESGVFKESLFSKLADLHENVLAVKVDGTTKEDYVWGLRVGFLTFAGKGITPEIYRVLEDKTAGAIRGNISNVSNLSQSLVLAAYGSSDYEAEKLEKFNQLQERYEKVKEVLRDPKFKETFTHLPFNSGYFMCVELKEGLNTEKVRQVLLEKYDTGVVVFGNLIRVTFASLAEEDIPQVFENIYLACQEVRLGP